MATTNWLTGTTGLWNSAANWSPAVIPNGPTVDVVIDAPAPAGASYTVTIGAGVLETVHTLSINGTNNKAGSNTNPYNAAAIEVDGTLAFGPALPGDVLPAGTLTGSLQTLMIVNGGTIINGGTIDAFIQAQGNVLFTGTNGFYVTNWLQSLASTVTINTASIAEMTGNVLFDGIFESKGPGSIINLGAPAGSLTNPAGLIVNIATIEGPPAIPDGWTEVLFNDPTAQINEWNGTAYQSIETSVTTIGSRGTVDVLAGRNYGTLNNLAVNTGGMLNLQAGTVGTPILNINGGVVQGFATINGQVLNNGTMTALGGKLTVVGDVTGTGVINFDNDGKTGALSAAKATLEVHGVAAGQTIVMNGSDTLQLDAPSQFSGSINAKNGDKIVVSGATVTGASLSGNKLILTNGASTVASLNMTGSFSGDTFTVAGSTVTVNSTSVAVHGASSQYIVADDNGALYLQDKVAGRDGTQVLTGTNTIVFSDGTGVFDPTGTAEDVSRLYLAALHRAPDIGGLLGWTNIVDNGHVPLANVAASFASSPEFMQTYGSLSDPAFIQQLYNNVLNRAGSADEVQAWQNSLAAGATRGQVTMSFAESPEGRADTLPIAGNKNDAEAYRLYQAAFNRVPDTAGEQFWSATLANGASPSQVANAFIGSAEFTQTYGALSTSDFVSTLYTNALHRPADAPGLQAWTNAIANGATRADVLVGFSDSLENRIQTASATHADWVFVANPAA